MVSSDIEKAIAKANENFSRGFVQNDASITASGFADDAVIFPPDAGMIQGKSAIEAFWRSVMASGVKEVSLNTVELSEGGDYVQERGTGVLKVQQPGGSSGSQNIKYVVVWKRTPDGWRNMWDIWNNSP